MSAHEITGAKAPCHDQVGSDSALSWNRPPSANEPMIDLKGRQVENRLEVSDGPCLDLAQNPEEAWPTVALHVFKRRNSVIWVSAIGQLHPLS